MSSTTATAEPAVTEPVAAPTPPVETTEEPFDKERAMATITKLREFEKENKRLKDDLEKRTKAEADAEAERLKADQKWEQLAESEKGKREAAEAALTAERLALRDRLAQAEVKAIAARLRFHKPEIAYRLIDTAKLDYDEDGNATNAETLLGELAKSDPYLIAGDDNGKRGIDGYGKTPSAAALTAELADKARERSDSFYRTAG